MMQKVTKYGYRGDARDQEEMGRSGGFVPKYLLSGHTGRLEGFIACRNKIDGKMGCSCAGFTEVELFNNARKKFLELMQRPIDIQGHVMFNKGGLLSTALAEDDAYGGYQYKMTIRCFEFSVAQAAARYRINARLPALVKNFKVYIDTVNIGQATLIAMTPRGEAELTFITPVQYQYLTYLGHI